MAVESKVFPLYEVENGTQFNINTEPEGLAVNEYLKIQNRYRHLTEDQIKSIQADVDEKWNRLKWLTTYKC